VRTRAVLGSIFASLSVLVVGWQAGQAVVNSAAASTAVAPPTSNTPSAASTPASSGGTSTSGSSAPAVAPASTGAADGTYVGSSVQTRFGNVQVQVTIAGGAITDVSALQLTDSDGRSVSISNRAAPILRSEVLQSQSASVSNVSGATYTTDGYLTSLQSALDQAGF
jgi:uncharacterized protein with FMN-binding domain